MLGLGRGRDGAVPSTVRLSRSTSSSAALAADSQRTGVASCARSGEPRGPSTARGWRARHARVAGTTPGPRATGTRGGRRVVARRESGWRARARRGASSGRPARVGARGRPAKGPAAGRKTQLARGGTHRGAGERAEGDTRGGEAGDAGDGLHRAEREVRPKRRALWRARPPLATPRWRLAFRSARTGPWRACASRPSCRRPRAAPPRSSCRCAPSTCVNPVRAGRPRPRPPPLPPRRAAGRGAAGSRAGEEGRGTGSRVGGSAGSGGEPGVRRGGG